MKKAHGTATSTATAVAATAATTTTIIAAATAALYIYACRPALHVVVVDVAFGIVISSPCIRQNGDGWIGWHELIFWAKAPRRHHSLTMSRQD